VLSKRVHTQNKYSSGAKLLVLFLYELENCVGNCEFRHVFDKTRIFNESTYLIVFVDKYMYYYVDLHI
jgi:hypothetical protein